MLIDDEACISTLPVEWPADSEFFDVVGEQYHASTVSRMREQIRSSASGAGGSVVDASPPSVILVEEHSNSHDPNAVAVMFPFSKVTTRSGHDSYDAETVGYLPKDHAKAFRSAMARFGISGRPLQVPGCVVAVSAADYDNVKIYLPRDFVKLCEKGYADDPANKPVWLSSRTLVAVKDHKHERDTSSYTLDDLRHIYCRYAKMKAWNSLPYMVEDKVAAWSKGIGSMRFAISFHHTGIDEAPGDIRSQ
jgi:hypothetical protein